MRTAPPAIDDANFHLLFPLLSFLRGRWAARRPLTLFIIYLSRPRGPFSARALVLASPALISAFPFRSRFEGEQHAAGEQESQQRGFELEAVS